MMRRLMLLGFAAALSMSNTGCLINTYSSDPLQRIEQLLNVSEDERQIEQEWKRFWFTDQPSHLSPERIHGGIQ